MTKRVLIGAGAAAVAAVLLWPRHPKRDAPPPPSITAPVTVSAPARPAMTEERRKQIEELGAVMRGTGQGGSAPVQQARERFDAGQQALEQKRYDDAAQAFRDAYELVPHPDLLYSAGLAYEQAGNCRQALAYFDRYLEERIVKREPDEAHIAGVRARCPS